MPTTKEINRLNDLFGSELGRNPYGESVYAWGYAPNLIRTRWAGIQEVRTPAGLITFEPKYEQCNLCLPALQPNGGFSREYWVLTKWCPAGMDPLQWNATFGGKMIYPARGYLVPTDVRLDPGDNPDTAITLELIGKIREQRKKKFGEFVEEYENLAAKDEQQKDALLDDAIGDVCTAFGKIPGSRHSSVSLPLPGTQSNYDNLKE
jgi:hypothetical protein